MTVYVTMIDILELHRRQLESHGGGEGIRDQGLLEAALFRPQSGYYADIIEEAAALWESLAQNHPFIDGNKRTAFAGTYAFLRVNGYYITVTADEVYTFIMSLYDAKDFSKDRLDAWLRANTKAV